MRTQLQFEHPGLMLCRTLILFVVACAVHGFNPPQWLELSPPHLDIEPFGPVSGGSFNSSTTAPVGASKDPLDGWQWSQSQPMPGIQKLQVFAMRPVAFLVESGSVLNASSLLHKDPGAAATVGTNGAVLRLEFPAECAGWFEFDSSDLVRADLGGKLTSLLGEDFAYSNVPMPPNQPSPGVYRLEDTAQGGKPNPELFDGARVARIIAPASSTGKTWTITGARLVC